MFRVPQPAPIKSMSNSDSSVKSHFLEHEIRDTSLDSGRDARPRVSTSESNPPKSKEARDQYALDNWYLQSRQYSLAINAYKRALELDPDCAAIRHSLGLAYYKGRGFRSCEKRPPQSNRTEFTECELPLCPGVITGRLE